MTPEQEKEFTPFNCLAFDLARLTTQQTDTKITCWLVSSENAKQQMRQEFVQQFNKLRNVSHTEHQVEQECNSIIQLTDLVRKWKNMEREFEQAREQGNPTAFFV